MIGISRIAMRPVHGVRAELHCCARRIIIPSQFEAMSAVAGLWPDRDS